MQGNESQKARASERLQLQGSVDGDELNRALKREIMLLFIGIHFVRLDFPRVFRLPNRLCRFLRPF